MPPNAEQNKTICVHRKQCDAENFPTLWKLSVYVKALNYELRRPTGKQFDRIPRPLTVFIHKRRFVHLLYACTILKRA